MDQASPGAWRCLVHAGPEWETAWAMGAHPPCQIPVPDNDRVRLAQSTDLDATTARLLAIDPTISVRRYVAYNPKIAPELLEQLSRDPNALVRQGVARRYQDTLPPSCLARLAADPQLQIRTDVAQRHDMPSSILEELAEDPESAVREYIASNKHTPDRLLRRLAADPDERVRRSVATNTNAPDDALEQLAHDPEEAFVAQYAAKNLAKRHPFGRKSLRNIAPLC